MQSDRKSNPIPTGAVRVFVVLPTGTKVQYRVWEETRERLWYWDALGKQDRTFTQQRAFEEARRWISEQS